MLGILAVRFLFYARIIFYTSNKNITYYYVNSFSFLLQLNRKTTFKWYGVSQQENCIRKLYENKIKSSTRN